MVTNAKQHEGNINNNNDYNGSSGDIKRVVLLNNYKKIDS